MAFHKGAVLLTVKVALEPPTTAEFVPPDKTKGLVAELELVPTSILFLVMLILGVVVPFVTVIGEFPVTLVTVPEGNVTGLAFTPFTVVVNCPPANEFEMELIIFTLAPITPLTVVESELFDEVLDTPVTILTAAPVVPFTVVVILLGAVTVLLTVVFAGAALTGTQEVPFHDKTCPELAPCWANPSGLAVVPLPVKVEFALIEFNSPIVFNVPALKPM